MIRNHKPLVLILLIVFLFCLVLYSALVWHFWPGPVHAAPAPRVTRTPGPSPTVMHRPRVTRTPGIAQTPEATPVRVWMPVVQH